MLSSIDSLPINVLIHIASFIPVYPACHVNSKLRKIKLSSNRLTPELLYNSIDILYALNKKIDIIDLFTYITVDTYKQLNFNKLQLHTDNVDFDVNNHLECAVLTYNRELTTYLNRIKYKMNLNLCVTIPVNEYVAMMNNPQNDQLHITNTACKYDQLYILRNLYKYSNFDPLNNLCTACTYNRYYIVKYILITVKQLDIRIYSALYIAISRQYNNIIRLILRVIKMNLVVLDNIILTNDRELIMLLYQTQKEYMLANMRVIFNIAILNKCWEIINYLYDMGH